MTVAALERDIATGDADDDALAAGLVEAARHGDGLSLIALPAPIAAPAALLASAPARDVAVLWEPRATSGSEWHLAGAGVAAEIRASGPDRIERVRDAARALWARVAGLDQLARIGAPAPRLIGGLSFAPGAWTAEWAPLGDAWFALPRWTYARRGDAAWLVLAVLGREALDAARWQRERAAIAQALATPLPAAAPRHVASVSEIDEDAWRREIDDIRAAIRGDRLAKVVAARPSVVELGEAIEPAAVLAALAERHPDCTRFAVRTGGVTFVGATPERLVRQQGRAVETDALAGSIARPASGEDQAAARLLGSAKDRWEHDLVVRGIAEILAPRCAELDVPAVPSVRPLRHVLHMHTPLRARLAEAGHVLDLVGALHPTPAVGGTPRAEAVAWIADREPPRGWYASPVGWFDADGDGDFAVAIRSGLIAGHRAQIWAGAGIVGDSDAEAELAEVRLKQRALLGALGVL